MCQSYCVPGVIGAATDRRGRSHAFVGERGRMTVLPGLGGTLSAPTAINGAGALILPGYCLDEKF